MTAMGEEGKEGESSGPRGHLSIKYQNFYLVTQKCRMIAIATGGGGGTAILSDLDFINYVVSGGLYKYRQNIWPQQEEGIRPIHC
jgi:hypothetical protein